MRNIYSTKTSEKMKSLHELRDVIEGKVKGSWTMFQLNDGDGNFSKINFNHRINTHSIDSFACLHNTNLQEINFSNSRGTLMMVYNSTINTWKLCFSYKLSLKGSVVYEWKGDVSEKGIPKFFYNDMTTYLRKFKHHFLKITYETIPDKSYFVNLIFKDKSSIPSYMHLSGGFPDTNKIDNCFDQSERGPCKLLIPTMATTDKIGNNDLELRWKTNITESIVEENLVNSKSWKIPKNNTKDSQIYDIVFVPSFKQVRPSHKCMGVTSPFDHVMTKRLMLPSQWRIKHVVEYDYKEKIPEQMDCGEFVSNFFSIALSIDQRLVHEGKRLRIFLITTQKEWKHLMYSEFERDQRHLKYGRGWEAIICTSAKDPIDIPGVYVSGWNEFSEDLKKEMTQDVDYNFGCKMHNIVKDGHGNRLCSKCKGVNHYLGQRSTARSGKNPAVGPKKIDKQQYCRKQWIHKEDEATRLYLESTVRNLPVIPSMYDIAHTYSAFVGYNTCDKLIYTSGKPNGNFSFSNESHFDIRDFIDRKVETDYLNELHDYASMDTANDNICNHINRIVDFKQKIPMPTTCAYLFCCSEINESENKIQDDNVYQYFDYCQLGLGKRLWHKTVHWMLPELIEHRTNLCLVVKEGVVYTRNCSNLAGLMIIAWGKSGGNPESRRNASNRRNEI